MKTILVTGAAGFIGSTFYRLMSQSHRVVILDKMTYAGHRENIDSESLAQGILVEGDIQNRDLVSQLLKTHEPQAIVNFAAESHVDNSISGPKEFIQTNINGVFSLLEAAREFYGQLTRDAKKEFRFVQVSTDEVFGSLGETGYFTETTPYAPNSPYSSSKAAGDMLARAWFHTYGLPTLITNCSNNYGPRQFPEKLIPRMIQCCLSEQALPVYGNGKNVRDWIHVEDHCAGVKLALERGQPGESYLFGGHSERSNLEVVGAICELLDAKKPRKSGASYKDLISFVPDRLGHDFRYAIDDSKSQKSLGFARKYESFEKGLDNTLNWYLENQNWVQTVTKKGKA